jgi:hypothetical protein
MVFLPSHWTDCFSYYLKFFEQICLKNRFPSVSYHIRLPLKVASEIFHGIVSGSWGRTHYRYLNIEKNKPVNNLVRFFVLFDITQNLSFSLINSKDPNLDSYPDPEP